MAQGSITLRGVEVHNLKGIDLDLPHRKLIVVCGVSGSGKTSLALDTLYAEGQRRYIESFSAYTRQFLERLEKPAAERIDGLPPAIAVTRSTASRSSRATIGTATETLDYLRLLFAKIGRVICPGCGQEVRRESPEQAAEMLASLAAGTRFMVAFAVPHQPEAQARGEPATTPTAPSRTDATVAAATVPSTAGQASSGPQPEHPLRAFREAGFARAIVAGRTINLSDPTPTTNPQDDQTPTYIHVDRLSAGSVTPERLRDSLETAFQRGGGTAQVFVESEQRPMLPTGPRGSEFALDGHRFWRIAFSDALRCEECGRDFPAPEPRLFSFNSPLGVCPTCEGFGNVVALDDALIVPDKTKTLRDGAIAPWTTPAYAHELQELIALADDFQIPLDVPYNHLTQDQLRPIREGIPERKFGGLNGFFAWLERRKYKTPIRVFLNRWKSSSICPVCGGRRLRPEALAVRIGGKNIAEWCELQVAAALAFCRTLARSASERGAADDPQPAHSLALQASVKEGHPPLAEKRVSGTLTPPTNPDPSTPTQRFLTPFSETLTDHEQRIARLMLEQVRARLSFLESVGLGYLSLDRTLKTLSAGEAQRVELTSALGSTLVGMLYVLDEPSVGLHPRDVDRLLTCITNLRDRGNTVVAVEHEEQIIRAADHLVEIGPGAGERGGEVVYHGPPADIVNCPKSLTGDYLAGRRGLSGVYHRRPAKQGRIRLTNARGNNLKNLNAEFPLGLLCLVTGVSGAGKSTLVQDTLYPALCRRLKEDAPPPLPFDDVFGDGQIENVVLVDQSPIGRSPRSNPVTYIKAFDEIRSVFAETADARMRNLTPSHFSFNVEGGRCTNCDGDGYLEIDMQFLADVYMKCPQCHGRRYRKEILQVKYRNKSIADVLDMTVREAFSFFRGSRKAQARLKQLIDVGLDYLRLGQPANTLSGGEAQRLKLAAFLAGKRRGRTLFILDEPTTGLHPADVVKLIDCFEALISVGHSLIVVEHNVQMMKAADWIVDIGPGAAQHGGQIVTCGTPEDVAKCAESATGQVLAEAFERERASVAELQGET